MCTGGQLLCDFNTGTTDRPQGLPDEVERCLTTTTEGRWVIWAHKVAFRQGEDFRALTGLSYPSDARAMCRRNPRHIAPDARCTCGFHAVSNRDAGVVGAIAALAPRADTRRVRGLARFVDWIAASAPVPTLLSVLLSGRILAFDYEDRSVLFRAERQTVLRVDGDEQQPGDPSGSREQSRPRHPVDVGPVRLELPADPVPNVEIADDAGFCVLARAQRRPRMPALIS